MVSYFKKQGVNRFDQQFLAGGPLTSWVRLLRLYGGIDRRYWPRGLYAIAIGLLSAPFRAYEHLRYDKIIENTEFPAPPIFILGHWRSGTTHVMRILNQDPDYAVVTFVHTMLPDIFLGTPVFRAILNGSIPETRPMDNVQLNAEVGEEEEYALGNMTRYSFYHALSFPRKMREIFDRAVLFEGVPPEEIEQWRQRYRYFLKKITYATGGKRLLLKNPANTARIPVLLKMFPDAKFIHICRNPYVVYNSTMNWLDKEMVPTALQDVEEDEVRKNALINYEKLMRRYLADKHLIPAGNLVEARFEDFETQPLGETERIYRELGLDLPAEVRARMQTYIQSVAGYKKNKYTLDPQLVQEISEHWGFAAQTWGYQPPGG